MLYFFPFYLPVFAFQNTVRCPKSQDRIPSVSLHHPRPMYVGITIVTILVIIVFLVLNVIIVVVVVIIVISTGLSAAVFHAIFLKPLN